MPIVSRIGDTTLSSWPGIRRASTTSRRACALRRASPSRFSGPTCHAGRTSAGSRARLQADDIVALVNNAGIAVAGPTVDMDPDSLEAMVQLNVVAATRLARAVAPGLAARGRGDIINIASVAGLKGDQPSISVGYSASKAYILAFSEGLASELAPRGVRVQAVLPGVTRTEIWEKGGIDVDTMPAEIIMDTADMVDAALAGLDLGESVTIPSLPDIRDWAAFKSAREALYPNLSHRRPAGRYAPAAAAA